jgi:peptidyl-prolyl cis-trans isomerase C
VHALVRVPPEADASRWAAAEAVAEAISKRVAPAAELARASSTGVRGDDAGDPAEQRFIELARETPNEGFEVVVQPLPPVAADGLSVQPEGRQPFDGAFVREAISLESRGALSRPFRSSFGWHVVLMLERLPAVRVPVEERRRLLTPDISDERIRARRAELLTRLRSEVPIEVERSADKLLEQAIAR